MDIKKLVNDKIKKRVRMNAAAGLIVKEGNSGEKLLLLIQRAAKDHWPHHWEFPRGKCDQGPQEDLISCLKREVKEETGLDIIPKHKIDDFQYLADKGTRLTTCHNFYCELKDPDQPVKLSHEHDRYKWVQSMGEIEMMVFPDQKRTAEKVLNVNSKIVNYPENDFTVNNRIEEYLSYIQKEI